MVREPGEEEPPDVALLERGPALTWLDKALDSAWCSFGQLVAVVGEAGIGKTSLLRCFVDEHAQDTMSRWGVCDPLVTPRPLAPLADIGRQAPWRSLLAQDGERAALFDAVLDDLATVRRRLVVVVEDVHWADQATLDLLVFLRRRIEQTRALVVVSYRDDEIDATHPMRVVLSELIPRSRLRLRLPPLSAKAVGQLAAGSDVDPDELYRVTGGNPFFVTETLAEADATVAGTVRDAVLARTWPLSADSRRALEVVAIVPGGAETWLVEELTGASTHSLDQCIERGILSADRSRLLFRHELARRAVLESVPPVRRRQLHLAALAALSERSEVDSARLAHHAEEADDADAILEHAPAAGARAAALGANREAARHYAVAFRHANRLAPVARGELAEQLSYRCYLTEQLDDAIAARAAALAIWRQEGDQRREGDTLRWLSRLTWFAGRNIDAAHYAEQAVRALEPFQGTVELAMAYSNMAQLMMLAHDVDAAVSWGERAVELAEQLGDVDVLAHALNNVGAALMWDERDGGRSALERSLDLSLREGLHEHAARAYTNLGTMLLNLRTDDDAARILREGIEFCAASDLDSWRVYMTATLARERFQRGDWDEAAGLASWVIARPGTAPISEMDALVVLGRVRARRGDPDVWPPLDRAAKLARETGELQRLAPAAAARAEARLLAGHPEVALDEIGTVLQLARSRGDRWLAGELAVLSSRADAAEVLEGPYAEPYQRYLSGDVEGAAARWEEMGCVYEAADALADSDNPAAVSSALDTLQLLGARPRAAQAARRLRGMGVRVPRGPNAATRDNAAQLTDREIDVLHLLATGRSNPEIAAELGITRKTAGHHVSHILTKLGARNRSEAAVIASRLDHGR